MMPMLFSALVWQFGAGGLLEGPVRQDGVVFQPPARPLSWEEMLSNFVPSLDQPEHLPVLVLFYGLIILIAGLAIAMGVRWARERRRAATVLPTMTFTASQPADTTPDVAQGATYLATPPPPPAPMAPMAQPVVTQGEVSTSPRRDDSPAAVDVLLGHTAVAVAAGLVVAGDLTAPEDPAPGQSDGQPADDGQSAEDGHTTDDTPPALEDSPVLEPSSSETRPMSEAHYDQVGLDVTPVTNPTAFDTGEPFTSTPDTYSDSSSAWSPSDPGSPLDVTFGFDSFGFGD